LNPRDLEGHRLSKPTLYQAVQPRISLQWDGHEHAPRNCAEALEALIGAMGIPLCEGLQFGFEAERREDGDYRGG
jgi:hypothetical protein